MQFKNGKHMSAKIIALNQALVDEWRQQEKTVRAANVAPPLRDMVCDVMRKHADQVETIRLQLMYGK